MHTVPWCTSVFGGLCRLLGFTCVKQRLERGYRKRAAHEVLRVPVLGATEPPTAVLTAVLCLWGDLHLFSKFVIDPYVLHELGARSRPSSDCCRCRRRHPSWLARLRPQWPCPRAAAACASR